MAGDGPRWRAEVDPRDMADDKKQLAHVRVFVAYGFDPEYQAGSLAIYKDDALAFASFVNQEVAFARPDTSTLAGRVPDVRR